MVAEVGESPWNIVEYGVDSTDAIGPPDFAEGTVRLQE